MQQETGLSRKQAEDLLAQAERKQDERGTKARTFYSVAFSLGEDVAGYTIGLQAFLAAGLLWLTLFLLYDGRSFLGGVCFGLMIYLALSIRAAHRQYQQRRAHGGADDAGKEALPQSA